MISGRNERRLPRSIRKHLRRGKAHLRRTLPPLEAQRAIDKLVNAVWRHGAPAAPKAARRPALDPGGETPPAPSRVAPHPVDDPAGHS